MMVKILALAGSLRADSLNKKVVKVAAEGAKAAGAEVTVVDLRDYEMPLYDGDIEKEQGLPTKAKELKELFKSHDGVLISSPEYNSGISGALKNAIDWVSRPEGDEPQVVAFKGKVCGLMGASPGGLGGLRGLFHTRYVLMNVHMIVLPNQVAVGGAMKLFDGDEMTDEKMKARLQGIGKEVAEMAQKLSA